jgi:hypothetical protein
LVKNVDLPCAKAKSAKSAALSMKAQRQENYGDDKTHCAQDGTPGGAHCQQDAYIANCYLTKRKLPHKASPNSKRADWASSMARRTISGRTHFMKNAGMVWIWYPLQQGLSNPGLLRMSSLSLDRRAVPWLPKAVKSREARWFPRLV